MIKPHKHLRRHSPAYGILSALLLSLTDALFDAESRRYVTEELDGRYDVSTTYDSFTVTLAGRGSDFGRLLELLRNAVINAQLTPELVNRLRDERIKAARADAPTPEALAERAAAARLFGIHPYGRLIGGSPESLGRIERADLMLTRERFLNPNNSTLYISGAIEPARVMRALRSSLGGWRKSDRIIPATFRQPEAPDLRTLLIDRAGAPEVALRLAVRSLAEADRDRAALRVLAPIVSERWRAANPQLAQVKMIAQHDARREGGMFIMGATVAHSSAAQVLESARAVLRDLAANGPSVTELEKARRTWVEAHNNEPPSSEANADSWLDGYTHDLASPNPSELKRAVGALTPAEVQRVAARLFLNTPSAAVAVGDASNLREALARSGGVEVFGEAASKPAPAPMPKPAQQSPLLQLKRP
ncbi:MAG: insulinase family protein [Acidobacteria bacterium]|nr:insulinase family protein [Acidobacteriota bacterium]